MDLSIISCTHNPDRSVFLQCLSAIESAQQASPLSTEVIIVDNGSHPSLEECDYVREFLVRGCRRRIVREPNIGLTFARLAGLRESQGQTIVFFDDDNLPKPDYLEGAIQLLQQYPLVAVWGPGIVEVVWEDGVRDWIKPLAWLFQAKSKRHTEFGLVVGWPDFFPPGTGMVVRRAVLERYAEQVEQGQLTATDRSGKRMTSAGDSQIVWTAVKMGLCAGTSPKLSLRHFIARRKATLRYVCRMNFGVMASFQIARAESFPEEKDSVRSSLPDTLKLHASIVLNILKIFLLLRLAGGLMKTIGEFGEMYGKYIAVGDQPPLILRLTARWLGYD